MADLNLFTVIQPQTAGATSKNWDARNCDCITVAADGLAASEKVQLLVLAGSTYKQVSDIYGTPINLTAECSSVALEGGAQYEFIKDVTAAVCGVYVSVKT